MIEIKVSYSNGYEMFTRINATLEEAKDYYLNQFFNIGSVTDNIQKCVSVELMH